MTFGVIFDMDGVLVDSYQAHFESWLRLAREHGLTMTPEQFATTFGRTSRDIIRHFWPDKANDDAQVAAWDRQKEQFYRDILLEHFPEMDGASDLLTALHAAGFRLAIGSSGPAENVQTVLRCLPAHVFDATVNGHDVKHGKPHPEVFLIASKKLGLPPASCVVVEDAPAGVQAGKAAGMAVIAITGTASREKLAAAGASLVVDSLREVSPAVVEELVRKAGISD